MKKTFIPIQNRICSLSHIGCNQPSKFNYSTCSKICGDLEIILNHHGAVPIIVLENGYCGLKEFGCLNSTLKNSKTGEYYTGCCSRHSEMVKRIMMTGHYVIMKNITLQEKLEDGIKKSYSSCWIENHNKNKPEIFIGNNYNN